MCYPFGDKRTPSRLAYFTSLKYRSVRRRDTHAKSNLFNVTNMTHEERKTNIIIVRNARAFADDVINVG